MRAFATLLAFLIAPIVIADAAEDRPPNVVVIFIDDMGYADIRPFGDTAYPTPNLDRMADEGRKFTDFVVSSAVCSASRSALLTGCYHRRVGFQGALGPKANVGINPAEMTLAELCKTKGYSTAAFGKWHLGHHPKFLPTNHGFEQYYGIPFSNDMWPLHPNSIEKRKKDPKAPIPWAELPMIEGTKIVNPSVQPEHQKLMTKQFTQRGVQFIHDNADKPFFLYLPHPMVHVPLYASDDFQGKSGAGIFGDVVMEIDWSVGQILKAIKDIGQDENTLVVFTSDNGPWLSYGTHSGKATPLREGKGTMFEGGYREPTIMRWKGKIPAGTTCDTFCSTIDIFPTVAAIIGADLPKQKIDGFDIRSILFGEPDAKSPHKGFLCYYKGGELQAVRNERFKLMFKHKYRTLDGAVGRHDGLPVNYTNVEIGSSLFDLDNDIGETINVYDEFPGVVSELKAYAELGRADLGDKLTKRVGSGVRPIGKLRPGDEKLPLVW